VAPSIRAVEFFSFWKYQGSVAFVRVSFRLWVGLCGWTCDAYIVHHCCPPRRLFYLLDETRVLLINNVRLEPSIVP
jgi:hypothetical protein